MSDSDSLADGVDLVRRYGIEPVVLHADDELDARLAQLRPVLVHALEIDPAVVESCRRLNLPLVAVHLGGHSSADVSIAGTLKDGGVDLVQVDSLHAAQCLAAMSSVETFCSRGVATREAFDLGRRRLPNLVETTTTIDGERPLRIVVADPLRPEGRQLEAIAAVGTLRRRGLDVRLRLVGAGVGATCMEYSTACQRQIERDGSRGRVAIIETLPTWNELYADSDLLLHLAPSSGFSPALRNAMAAGVLIVAPPHADLAELLRDGITSLVCGGGDVPEIAARLRHAAGLAEADWLAMLRQARRVALAEFHPHRIANDLFSMYLRAMDAHVPAVGQPIDRRDAGFARPHLPQVRGHRRRTGLQPVLKSLTVDLH